MMNSIQEKIDYILPKVNKPGRYIGNEPNIIIKKNADLRFAFCFPDIYEIGMSSMGLALLYNIVNSMEGIAFERCFSPDFDMAENMRKHDLPLFTLETKTPLKECDLVGFTLSYELCYTGILYMLDLADIPFRSSDRDDSYPLIIAGGPCTFNPEPLSSFFDIFLIGDGEDQLPNLISKYKECKNKNMSKDDILKELIQIDGVYAPKLKNKVTRAFINDLDSVNFPKKPIIPLLEAVQERSVVELFRGCTRGCRFCQAGMLYRPVRERSIDKIEDIAIKQLQDTGHKEVSLLSLSTSDYTNINKLVSDLADYCIPRKIGISLPSLRLDNFDFGMLEKIQKGKKTGLTFACEAGTQRLRDVINKNVTEEDLLTTISKAIELGWNSVKLYFMIGLPTENYEDLDGIADLTFKISKLARDNGNYRFNVNISVSNFVPKPFTPFQWVRQNSEQEFNEKHEYLRSKIGKIKGVTLHYHGSFTSILESLFARGDASLSYLLETAYKNGCNFDSWTEHFNRDAWEKSLKECGIEYDNKAFTGFEISDILPWDYINSGVNKEYLISEYNKSLNVQTTRDCRFGCNGCGINSLAECKFGGIYE